MTGWDAIRDNGMYIEIVRSVLPQLEQIQVECVSEQDVGDGGCEGEGDVVIRNIGKGRGI
jgi:hypothetical protein